MGWTERDKEGGAGGRREERTAVLKSSWGGGRDVFFLVFLFLFVACNFTVLVVCGVDFLYVCDCVLAVGGAYLSLVMLLVFGRRLARSGPRETSGCSAA